MNFLVNEKLKNFLENRTPDVSKGNLLIGAWLINQLSDNDRLFSDILVDFHFAISASDSNFGRLVHLFKILFIITN